MALELTLPSGTVVRVRAPKRSRRADDTVEGRRVFEGRTLAALLRGELIVERREGRAWKVLDASAIHALLVRDYVVLREAAARLGAIASEPVEHTCRNCEQPFFVAHAEEEPAELEGRFDDEPPVPRGPFPLGGTVKLARGLRVKHVRMTPVTVEEALPLWARLAANEPLRMSPALVRALGVRALGEVRHATALSDALRALSDARFRIVEQVWLRLNYPVRAFLPWTCAACGALHEVDAPAEREFDFDAEAFERAFPLQAEETPVDDEHPPRRPPADPDAPFPSDEAFDALVARLVPEVFAARGVQKLSVHVEHGVAGVDSGGEPMLGSYEPVQEVDLAGNPRTDFLITIYRRTFQKMFEEDGPYDVEAEIRETLDHEVQHHLYHLDGHDPMDREEREAARAELERTVGKKHARRLIARTVARSTAEELVGFVKFAVPSLAVIGAVWWLFLWLVGR